MKTPVEFSAISFKTGLDHSKYLYNESGHTGYFYAEAKAMKSEAEGKSRAPLNIALVIDRSGSMDGEKLRHAKLAAQYVIDQLSAEDYVSIVQYDDAVQVVATANRVGDKQLLRRKIDAIQAGGSTNLGGGMLEGYAQVKSTFRKGAVNRVLLLSDGLANVGITSVDELQRMARNKNLEEGITISTFGLGLDYNENLMTNIAEYGSGNYYFIRTPEEISAIFQKELSGLLNVVAQNATLTIDLPTGFSLVKVYGYPYEQSGNRITVRFRDVFSEETKAVMVKFSCRGNAPKYGVAASLTYDEATSATLVPRKVESMDYLSLVASVEELGGSGSDWVATQVVLFEANDKLEEAMREVDAGNYEVARQRVEENAAYLKMNESVVSASPELKAQMSANASYQSELSNVEALGARERNLMQKSAKVTNYDARKKR